MPILSAVALALVLVPRPGLAQEVETPAAPAAPQQNQLPPSTNPAQRVIYAGEGQTQEQQMSDQLACYNYATEQTSWNPHEAYAVLEKEHGAALKQYQESFRWRGRRDPCAACAACGSRRFRAGGRGVQGPVPAVGSELGGLHAGQEVRRQLNS
jgi:hypothetical protein